MADSLAGRHAVVTGGGRGIGAAVAEALAGAGARVTVMGRNRDALEVEAEKLGRSTKAQAVEVDVAEPESVERAFARAAQEFGPPAILINNAGQAASAPFQKTDMALWRRMLDVNLTGSFLCAQAAVAGMLQGGYGRIVNVASIAGLAGAPYIAAYCAAKHGVIGLTRALALEFARKNITVNAVCPAYTETDMVGAVSPALQTIIKGKIPMGRFAHPEEIAKAVLFLVADGDFITGQQINVNGGVFM